MKIDLKERKAIVCGASRGLGYHCARGLAEADADVVLVARTQANLEKAAIELNVLGSGEISTVSADVCSDHGQSAILDSCPNPDILVTNADGPPAGDFRTWGRAEWHAAVDANMLTPIELIKAIVDGMISRKYGRIINITSSAVKSPISVLGLSNGARAGLTGFVAGLARDVAKHNVTINNILPGPFETQRLENILKAQAKMQSRSYEDVRSEWLSAIPSGCFGRPEEFGITCVFLCVAGHMTGQNLLLDGGQYPGIF